MVEQQIVQEASISLPVLMTFGLIAVPLASYSVIVTAFRSEGRVRAERVVGSLLCILAFTAVAYALLSLAGIPRLTVWESMLIGGVVGLAAYEFVPIPVVKKVGRVLPEKIVGRFFDDDDDTPR